MNLSQVRGQHGQGQGMLGSEPQLQLLPCINSPPPNPGRGPWEHMLSSEDGRAHFPRGGILTQHLHQLIWSI